MYNKQYESTYLTIMSVFIAAPWMTEAPYHDQVQCYGQFQLVLTGNILFQKIPSVSCALCHLVLSCVIIFTICIYTRIYIFYTVAAWSAY